MITKYINKKINKAVTIIIIKDTIKYLSILSHELKYNLKINSYY